MSFPQIVPFYLFVIDARLLITSPIVPNDISDSKNIVYAETGIPGLPYSPVSSGGFGNRKISFSLQIIKRNNIEGNSLLVKLYEILRNPAANIQDVFLQGSNQFVQNPKVLYNYGIGSVPLVWYVTKCDFVHNGRYTNAIGNPQFTTVNLELTLDETDPTNDVEKVFRQFAAITGGIEATTQVTLDQLGRRPF